MIQIKKEYSIINKRKFIKLFLNYVQFYFNNVNEIWIKFKQEYVDDNIRFINICNCYFVSIYCVCLFQINEIFRGRFNYI